MSLLALFRLSADTKALAPLRHAIAHACFSGESQAGLTAVFSEKALRQYQSADQNPEQIMLALLEAELTEQSKDPSAFLTDTSRSSLDDVPMLVAHIQRNLSRELNQPEQIETLFTPPTVGDAKRLVDLAKKGITVYLGLHPEQQATLRAQRLEQILDWFLTTVGKEELSAIQNSASMPLLDTPLVNLQGVLVALLAVFESSKRLRTQLATEWLLTHTTKPIFLPSALTEAQKAGSSLEAQAQFLLERALAGYSHSKDETLELRIYVNRAKTKLLTDPTEIIFPSDLQLGSLPRMAVINNHSAFIIAIREALQNYRAKNHVFSDAFLNYLAFCYTNDQEKSETFLLKEEAALLALLLAIVQKPGAKSSTALSFALTDLARLMQGKLLEEQVIVQNGITIHTLISSFFSDASLHIVQKIPGFRVLVENQPASFLEAPVTVGFWYLLQLLLKQYSYRAQEAILSASNYTRKQLLIPTQTPQASDLGITRKTLKQFETYTDDDEPHAVPVSTKLPATQNFSVNPIIEPEILCLKIIGATNRYKPQRNFRHGSEGQIRKKMFSR